MVKPGKEYLATWPPEAADLLTSVRGPDGEKPDLMPDLTVYFDNLHYGSNVAMGFGSSYGLETAKGLDDSNHGEFGMFILSDPEGRVKGGPRASE